MLALALVRIPAEYGGRLCRAAGVGWGCGLQDGEGRHCAGWCHQWRERWWTTAGRVVRVLDGSVPGAGFAAAWSVFGAGALIVLKLHWVVVEGSGDFKLTCRDILRAEWAAVLVAGSLQISSREGHQIPEGLLHSVLVGFQN